jgi:hypothetical protein
MPIKINKEMQELAERERALIGQKTRLTALSDGSNDVSVQAVELVVQTAEDYSDGAETLKGIKALRAEVASEYDPVVKAAYASHKQAVALKKRIDGVLETAEQTVKAKLSAWAIAQETSVAERQAQRESRVLEMATVARDATVAGLRADGDGQGAAQVLADPLVVPPVPVERAVPRIDGITHKTTWSAEVTNQEALVRACLEEPRWWHLIKVDTKGLDRMARALKANLDIPGVVVRKHSTVAIRKDTHGLVE